MSEYNKTNKIEKTNKNMNRIQFYYNLLYNKMELVNIAYTHFVSQNLIKNNFIT